MKLFKKHKAKEKTILNVGIQECRTCEKNIRCAECFNLKENKVLKEALEKQMPKKPLNIEETKYKVSYKCPVCGTVHVNGWCGTNWKLPFCSICGQALDWSENNG